MTGMDIQSVLMVAALIAVPVALIVFIVRRRLARTLDARLRRACPQILHDFLLPDGNEGEIHFEYAVLTPGGIWVIDTKDVEGNVFGSDTMDEWTVIHDNQRFTFNNPQGGLLDRCAAVKAIATEVPVEGFIAFTDRARFSKGQPDSVIFFDTLIDRIAELMPEPSAAIKDDYVAGWNTVVAQATVKGVGQALVK